jgi:hypothetical protein
MIHASRTASDRPRTAAAGLADIFVRFRNARPDASGGVLGLYAFLQNVRYLGLIYGVKYPVQTASHYGRARVRVREGTSGPDAGQRRPPRRALHEGAKMRKNGAAMTPRSLTLRKPNP